MAEPAAASTAGSPAAASAAGVLAVLLAVILLLVTWFIVAGDFGRPSITVNEHTDNAVPTVDVRVPARPVTA